MSLAATPLSAWVALAVGAMSGAASVFTGAAAMLVARFGRAKHAEGIEASPGMSMLKPLHGNEPALLERLLHLCDQRRCGPLQIVVGCQDPADPAIAVVRQLMRLRPEADLDLVVSRRGAGSNRKVANLVAIAERARHDILVVADSDIDVPRDYAARLATLLAEPGVGAVTCLYTGEARGGLGAVLAALAINAHFLPNAVAGMALAGATPCFGSTIALRRDTLDRIGGFAAFGDQLADDYAIGDAVRAVGQRVAVAPFPVVHACCETSVGAFLRHQLRVLRTIRSINPTGHVGSILTYPFPLALACLATTLAAPRHGIDLPLIGFLLVGLALAVRLVLCLTVERRFAAPRHSLWLLPMLDAFSFVLFLASFLGSTVSWRGYGYTVLRDGTVLQKGA